MAKIGEQIFFNFKFLLIPGGIEKNCFPNFGNFFYGIRKGLS